MTTAAERLKKLRESAAGRPAVDLTSQISSDVMDQGPRPTCVACALAAAHEAERSGFEAAIEPIWWRLREWGLAGHDGTTLGSAGHALPHTGHCDADLWPYNDSLGFESEPPPASAGIPPWTRANLSPVVIAHDGVEDAVEHELADGHPVVLVIEISANFRTPDLDGYVTVPPITAPAEGYHAVVVTGAWTDLTHGRVFLIRNSWGEFWGAGGYGLLPVEYLINFGAQAARILI
ncbi:MAG: C1 family peptidase [Jatrophihabitans sp.]